MSKNQLHIQRIVLTMILLFGGVVESHAQLVYDRAGNPGWNGATAWSGGAWSPGSSANFGTSDVETTLTVSMAGFNNTVGGMTTAGTQVIVFTGNGSLAFSGGSINGGFRFSTNSKVSGNLTVQSGATTFTTVGSNGSAYSGTATIASAAELFVTDGGRLGSTSNVTVQDGGRFTVDSVVTSMGTLDLTGSGIGSAGALRLGGNGLVATSLTVSELTGSGSIRVRSNDNAVVNSLIVNGAGDSNFSGLISGKVSNATLALTKSGAGALSLSGNLTDIEQTVTVNGGELFINSATTDFSDSVGSTAISVTGTGVLGGTGTITTLAGENVVIGSGGGLAAGSMDGSAGQTTFALGTGAELNVAAATAGSGWLKFELGADTGAGTTYDQIVTTGGNLNIGSGLLNFADFEWTLLSGFGEGTYTLFDNVGSITGTLADSGLGGTLGGYNGLLSISGNDLVLSVTAIPEPSVTALIGLGILGLIVLRARRVRAALGR